MTPDELSDAEMLETMPNIQTARRVAVFGTGSSGMAPDQFAEAEALGAGLAKAGWVVLSGGYGGAMHAVSRGAAAAGGTVIAVTAEFRPDEQPNPHSTYEVRHLDLLARARYFIETADAYLVLPGGVGTLAELALTWAHLKTEAWGPDSPPLLLWQDPWREVLRGLETSPGFWKPDLDLLEWVRDPADALAIMNRRVLIGRALRHYEADVLSRRGALEAYLNAGCGGVRRAYTRLEPLIWRLPEARGRETVLALAATLAGVEAADLDPLAAQPFLDGASEELDTWSREFGPPSKGRCKAGHRARALKLREGAVVVQEYEETRDALDDPGGGRQKAASLRVVNLARGWVVTLDLGPDAYIGVCGASPRQSRELLERVEGALEA